MSPLATRVATAAVLVPVVLAALFVLPPAGWAAATLAAIGLAAVEWARLAGVGRRGTLVYAAVIVAAGALLLVAPQAGFSRGWPGAVVTAVCGVATAFWLAVGIAWVVRRWPTRPPAAMLAVGAIVLAGAWVALVELQARSPWHVLAAMAIVWIADTAAYFAGRAFGRRKLAPLVSPGKTWEGVFGALAAVAAYAFALAPAARAAGYDGPLSAFALAGWVALAVALAGLSVVGDLFESWLKRCAGVKDSGNALPGHGGVLDRTDALLAAMPPAALAAQALLRG
ncbi:MAG: phosphatidate cytidylyltransferase [Burkholderiales bacterium]